MHDRSTVTNNVPWRCKQQKKLKTSRLTGRVVFASIYMKYSIKVEGGFHRAQQLTELLFMQPIEADKTSNASGARY